MERKAPLIKENSELERCGTSESVWWSQVYKTNQQLTTNNGPKYIPIIGKVPCLIAKIISPIITAATPISEIQTFLAHTAGHNPLEKGSLGQKWFEVPYLIPPVLPDNK